MTLTAYRVHCKPLRKGELVPASNHFFEALSHDKARGVVEAAFADNRPAGKPRRADSIFVFPDIQTARDWICRRTNDHLLRVSVPENGVEHEADWRWLAKALLASDPTSCARDYWRGKMLPNPIKEWLVSEAIVEEEIPVPESERQEWRKKHLGWATGWEMAEDIRRNSTQS